MTITIENSYTSEKVMVQTSTMTFYPTISTFFVGGDMIRGKRSSNLIQTIVK